MRLMIAIIGMALMGGIEVSKGEDSFFAEHPLFVPLIGEWEGQGELTTHEGKVIVVEESWTGSIEENGNFLVKGTRKFNDDSHTFEWEYLYNPTTELVESVMRMSTSEKEMRLEVNLSEQDKTITLKSQLEGGGGSLKVVNTIGDKKITGTVELVGVDGTTTVEGKVVHEKKEKPGE